MDSLDLNKDTETAENEISENKEVTLNSEAEVKAVQTEEPKKHRASKKTKDTELILLETTPEVIEIVETDTEITEEQTIVAKKTIEPELTVTTKSELVEKLRALIDKEVEEVKDEVETIKQQFYKKTKAEIEELKKAFEEAKEDVSEFIAPKDEHEEIFKSLLNTFRTKKAALAAQHEKEKESNLLQKRHILEQMKTLVDSNDDVSSHIAEFRNLQQKWKSIGQVPQAASTELWKQYNLYQESFWDLIKINNELREYDFKKNLEAKNQICDVAEKLDSEKDVITAFQHLQKLHEEWHNLGPVAREIREQIWNRFKEASTVINKKHQSYFDSIRKIEEENFEAKSALCDKIEAFDFSTLNNYKGWDDATKIMLAWQEEWRTIGFAPRKVNQKVFDRYRKACDSFFSAKAEFYKDTKNVLTQNTDKKKALCEKAEALKESTEWKETGDKLIQLQKEWKTIGPVAKKLSDELWKRFISACDYFFEQKTKIVQVNGMLKLKIWQKRKNLLQK